MIVRKRPREKYLRRISRYGFDLREYRRRISSRRKARAKLETIDMARTFTLSEAQTLLPVLESLLRSAMGMQTTPPNSVMISLALFLTAFIMSPVLEKSYQDGIVPLIDQKISEDQAFERTTSPLRGFMLQNVREADLKLFADIAKAGPFASKDDVPLRIVVPSFLISELRRAFEIGFLLFVPFLIIDMVVASILMSMGMMMLPPVTISLPFKIIFFVLVDGWYLVAGSLVRSYYT